MTPEEFKEYRYKHEKVIADAIAEAEYQLSKAEVYLIDLTAEAKIQNLKKQRKFYEGIVHLISQAKEKMEVMFERINGGL